MYLCTFWGWGEIDDLDTSCTWIHHVPYLSCPNIMQHNILSNPGDDASGAPVAAIGGAVGGLVVAGLGGAIIIILIIICMRRKNGELNVRYPLLA